jgi:hypothetical protein
MPDSAPDDFNQHRIAATADRLRRMIERSCAWPDEIEDILLAVEALGVDLLDQRTHDRAPDLMFYLIRDVHRATGTDAVVPLDPEHKQWLAEAVKRMQPDA